MLLIPTYLAPSKIHGIGVFTSTFLSKGVEIWRFDASVDEVFTDAEFKALLNAAPVAFGDKLRAWTYFENGRWILCGDNARFFNHDETNPSTAEQRGVMRTTTSRELYPGDELTCNYKDFDDNDKLVAGPLYPAAKIVVDFHADLEYQQPINRF